jgi:hypothetical protein
MKTIALGCTLDAVFYLIHTKGQIKWAYYAIHYMLHGFQMHITLGQLVSHILQIHIMSHIFHNIVICLGPIGLGVKTRNNGLICVNL